MTDKKILSFILVFISAAAGIYFRFYPKLMPVFDILATHDVYGEERAALSNSVRDKYPGMPAQAQAKVVGQLFKDTLRSEGDQIRLEISRKADEYKQHFKDPEGRVYVNGIDSYYFLRLLDNLLKTGDVGVKIVNGIGHDDLVLSPVDPVTKKNVHLWLGLIFYKIAHFFNKDIPLQEAVFYLPLSLSVVLAVFSFYVARQLGANDLGAFFASITVNLSPFFLGRSVGEWFRTDIYNVLLPLLVFGTFLFALRAAGILRRLFFCGLSGLFLAFYASTWKGWWNIFDIMLLSGLLFLWNKKLSADETEESNQHLKVQATCFGFFFIFSTLFTVLLNGFSVWKDFIAEPLRLSTILKITPHTVWPNVYLTVAELNPTTPSGIVNLLGGNLFFFSAMFCLIYILLVERGIRDDRLGFGILVLVFWILSTFYAGLEAMRFVLLLVVPVGLSFGLAVTKTYQLIEEKAPVYLRQKAVVLLRLGATGLFSAFLVFDMHSIHLQLLNTYPSMNNYWYDTLTAIKNKTSPDAIIDSWWDFGHWFKSVGQRRVLFDGMTQDTPYAYWVANALLTDDEEEAVGILRMINTNDNKAADLLEQEAGFSASKAVAVIKKAVRLDRESCRKYLSGEVPGEKVDRLMGFLFPEKLPEVYFIVSSDMLVKIGPISYIGNWDFEKVDAYFKGKSLTKDDFYAYLMKNYNLTQGQAEERFLEVSFLSSREAKVLFSKYLGFFSGLSPAKEDGKLLFFDNGLVVDLDNHHAYVASPYPERRGRLKSLVYPEDGQLKEEVFKDPDLFYSALMFKDQEQYKSVFLDTALARSMLVRLYLLQGKGLKHFKLWHKEVDDKDNAIYTYEIVWSSQTSPARTP